MKLSLRLFLLVCCGMFHLGSAIRCYNCQSGESCTETVDCGTKDSCLSLTTLDQKTYQQCIDYSQCSGSKVSQLFPSVGKFTYQCCNRNLCNSANAVTMTKPVLALVGAVLSIWWRFI